MKKKMLKFLAGVLISCTLAGSAVSVQAEDNLEMQVTSYLTGEDVPESVGRRRPIAVMLAMIPTVHPRAVPEMPGLFMKHLWMAALPGLWRSSRITIICRESALCEAAVIIIFSTPMICAIYAHYGQAVYALQYLDQHVIDNLNGLTLGNAYYRTTDRVAPHNAYTDAAHLQAGIQSLGYSQQYPEGYTGHYQFAPEGTEITLDEGAPATLVKLDNFWDNHPWFEYNAETKEYSRFQFNAPHVDQLTGQQLTCDNIILQYSGYQAYDANGYLNIDTQSGGSGKYITRGKAIDITWSKDSQWGTTHYYDSNGQEIQLNRGKTWVEIVLNDSVGSVTLQ